MSILSQIAESRKSGFTPSSPDEFFALRLAVRLGEPEAAAHYLMLASQYAQEYLLGAYRFAKRRQGSYESLAKLFHGALSRQVGAARSKKYRTAAVAIERRRVAIAVFCGAHLEDLRVRHLPGQPSKMAASALSLVRSVLSEHHIETAAVEQSVPAKRPTVKATVMTAVAEQLRAEGLPLWEFLRSEVTGAFAHPAPKKA